MSNSNSNSNSSTSSSTGKAKAEAESDPLQCLLAKLESVGKGTWECEVDDQWNLYFSLSEPSRHGVFFQLRDIEKTNAWYTFSQSGIFQHLCHDHKVGMYNTMSDIYKLMNTEYKAISDTTTISTFN